MSDWQDINAAPKDGSILKLKCESKPEYGEHVMWWSKRKKRWENYQYAICRKIKCWWDENCEQPTHFQLLHTPSQESK